MYENMRKKYNKDKDKDRNILSTKTKKQIDLLKKDQIEEHNKLRWVKLNELNRKVLQDKINIVMMAHPEILKLHLIILKQPSKELIEFQQIKKDLVQRQMLEKYYSFEEIRGNIKDVFTKNIKKFNFNYVDFKLPIYRILNQYKIFQRIMNKNQSSKQNHSSKLSSTKQQHKILYELTRKINNQKNRYHKKTLSLKTEFQIQKDKFQMKQLTHKIQDLIQDIKDNRVLEQFKKQIQKDSKIIYYPNSRSSKAKLNTFVNSFQSFQLQNYQKMPEEYQSKDQTPTQYQKLQPQKNIKTNKSKNKAFEQSLNKNKKLSKNSKISILKSQQQKTQRFGAMHSEASIQQYGLNINNNKIKILKSKLKKSKSKPKLQDDYKLPAQFDHKRQTSSSYYNNYNQYSNSCDDLQLFNQKDDEDKVYQNSRFPTEYDSSPIDIKVSNKGKFKVKSKSKQNGLKFNKKSKSRSKLHLNKFKQQKSISKYQLKSRQY